MTQGQEKLQNLLKYLGINIPALSALLNVEKQRLYDIQSGKTKKFSFELASIIHDAYDEINLDWLVGKSDIMIVFSQGDESPQSGNPFFENLTIQGGAARGDGTELSVIPDGYMSVPGIYTSPDIPFIRVRGNSMLNTSDPNHSIPNGSWIAVKRAMSGAIMWGEVYAMETVDGPIVKKIMPSEKDGHIKCVSFNRDYPPFDLPVSDIINNALYLVMGVVDVQVWH